MHGKTRHGNAEGIYLFKVNKKTLEKGVKYVLSLQKNTKKTPMVSF